MIRLLFVEDEPESVEPVVRQLKRNKPEYVCKGTTFSDAQNDIKEFLPDIVVLDLLDKGSNAERRPIGLETYKFVWETRFCPVVVFSAQPEIVSNEEPENPFVRLIAKGVTGADDVEAALVGLEPQVRALQNAEEHMRDTFACAMRDVAPYAFAEIRDANERSEVLLRSGRRRVAALMDDLSHQGGRLASWEQYVSPPVSSDVLLADVLHLSSGTREDPSAFRLVLTPSCDLVTSRGQVAKVDLVLVAHCCTVGEGIVGANLWRKDQEKFRDGIKDRMLTQGFLQKFIPFPRLPGRIPSMMADLKRLELLPLKEVGNDARSKYRRIASLDSPFRELVAWAYMQVACRPGLPERNFVAWAEEIVGAFTGEGTKA